MRVNQRSGRGFTLVELSIVLVIIGLFIGGVLVGQDLIRAAAERAQISQIEKFNTAVNTFKEKYNALPGDIAAPSASQFGFIPRSGDVGRGDGNGEIDGWAGLAVSWNAAGETFLFWEDLSSARLIDGTFNTYVDGSYPPCTLGGTCKNYFPAAKIGGGNMIYVYSGSASVTCPPSHVGCGPNFFGLSVAAVGAQSNFGSLLGGTSNSGLTVAQAYAIDKKIDDGLPTTGWVLAQFLDPVDGTQSWSIHGTTPSATNCYDTSTGPAAYAVSYSNGANVNCGLSFGFQ